jgi:hypothetical protein
LETVSRYPRTLAELSDLKEAARKYVLPGFVPEAPIISPADLVITQGSCFADNIYKALKERGQECRTLSLNEFVNSPAFNAAVFSYICEGKPIERPDHAAAFKGFDFAAARAGMARAKVLVLTLGVANYTATADGVPTFDGSGIWYTPSLEQLNADMRSIVRSVRSVSTQAEIVFTVSPVALNRSPWMPSGVVADALSKCSLRMAAQPIISEKLVRYWPSFEIVRWLGSHIPGAYGGTDKHQRLVSDKFIGVIVDLFLEAYTIKA